MRPGTLPGALALVGMLRAGPALGAPASVEPGTEAAARTDSGVSHRPALDEGDLAWAGGERGEARSAWRVAASSQDPAVRAQAELRLLLVSGSVGLAVHGPRADAALLQCPVEDAWCDIATAERELYLRQLGLPWSPGRTRTALARAEAALPEVVRTRRVWLGEVDPDELASVPIPPDGLGQGLQAHAGRYPSGPGTWVLGLGVAGASGQGVGGGLRLVHPDLGWKGHRLTAEAGLTSRGAGQLSLRLQTHPQQGAFTVASLRGQRLVQDTWQDGVAVGIEQAGVAVASLALGRQFDSGFTVWAGPMLRADLVNDELIQGHGAVGGTSWRPGPAWRHTLSLELSAVGTGFLGSRLELAWIPTTAGSHPAVQLLGQWVPWSTGPDWRLPTVGGGQVLRSGSVGRLRAEELVAAVVEWRQGVGSALELVPFVEGAWVDGPHGGGGLGLRLKLPPRPNNTLRLDVAMGDIGFGLSVGWGDFF